MSGDGFREDACKRAEWVLDCCWNSRFTSILYNANAIDTAFFKNDSFNSFIVLSVLFQSPTIPKTRSVNYGKIHVANLDLILHSIACLWSHRSACWVLDSDYVKSSAGLNANYAFHSSLSVEKKIQKGSFALTSRAEYQNHIFVLEFRFSRRKNWLKNLDSSLVRRFFGFFGCLCFSQGLSEGIGSEISKRSTNFSCSRFSKNISIF